MRYYKTAKQDFLGGSILNKSKNQTGMREQALEIINDARSAAEVLPEAIQKELAQRFLGACEYARTQELLREKAG